MVDELFASDRFIVTNIELNLPELAQFIHDEQKSKFTLDEPVPDAPEIDLDSRIRVLNDDEASQFWLYEPGRDFMQRKKVKQGTRILDCPDFEDRAKRGCLYVIDEVHTFFGAREWQNTGTDCTFFLTQHRKLRCDVIFITQHPDQVDKALRRLAQDYVQMRNLSREPVMGFRIGSVFRWSRSLNSPTGGNPRVFESGFLKLDVARYGKLYDTMAGVGIQGRVAPKVEAKGRSLWWLLPPAAVLVFLVFFGPRLLAMAGQKTMQHLVGKTVDAFGPGKAVKIAVNTNEPARALPEPSQVPAVESQRLAPERTVAHSRATVAGASDDLPGLLGFAWTGQHTVAFLSDGRQVTSDDPDWERLTKEGLKYGGVVYRRVLSRNTAPLERLEPAEGVSRWSGGGVVTQTVPGVPASVVPQVSPRYQLTVHNSDGSTYQRLLPQGGDVVSPEPTVIEHTAPVDAPPMPPLLRPATVRP